MTNVSKNKLNPTKQKELFMQLASLFSNSDTQHIAVLLEGILTNVEKIMLIKRLAIVLMLTKEHSTYTIAKTLHVSDSTVRDLQLKYEQGTFDSVIGAVTKRSFDKERFWETVEVLLRLGMPSYGKGRWKSVFKDSKKAH